MEKKVTRNEFLKISSKYAIGAAAGVASLHMLNNNKVFAGTKQAAWPYAYVALDAEVVRQKAHYLYYNGKDCCSGVFGGLVATLATEVGDPWTNFPIEVMLFGRGGGVGWGTLCGAINGGAALISLVTEKAPSGALINELWGFYTTENLPTDAANAATYETQNYVGTLPQNIAGSPLCHNSVSQWCVIADKKVHSDERKERCARIAGDVAAKTVEILNAYFAETFTPTFADSDGVAACLSCHGSGDSKRDDVMTHMECSSCHDDPHATTAIETDGIGIPVKHKLVQNYPNPFNPETTIKFSLPKSGIVRLDVYSIKGELIKSMVNSDFLQAGEYKIKWDGKNAGGMQVSSGLYLARLTTENFMQTIKMNLIK